MTTVESSIASHAKTKMAQLLDRIERQQATIDELSVILAAKDETIRELRLSIRAHKGAYTKLRDGAKPRCKPDPSQKRLPL